MRAGVTESDAYLAEWRTSEPAERDGDPEPVAATIVAELQAAYSPARLKALIASGGRE